MRLPAVVLAASLAASSPQAPRSGKIIEAGDGDVIVIRDRAAVRIVRRMEGDVRAIYNAAQRSIVVLVDQAIPGKAPDGRVDATFTFNDLDGAWPLGERWEGRATIDDYSVAGELGNSGIGLTTPGGLVQILSGRRTAQGTPAASFQDAGAIATLTSMGGGRGSGGNETFEQAEQRQTGVAARNAANLSPQFTSSVNLRIEPSGTPAETSYPSRYPAPAAPVRVGSVIKTPVKVEDAAPVLPEAARQAGVRGVVVVEVTVGADGRVTDAKVLRSIPMLDRAALDAVRQWRYEPTLLNGAAVPVIITATVEFR
jgi:protein TonB